MLSEKSALKKFDISVFLHFVGREMYSVFVPIIMLKNGYSLNLVFSYILLSSIVTIICSYIAQKTFHHHRVIFFNYLAIIAEIILLLLLNYSKITGAVFAGILIFEGAYYGFYYISYFSIINHYSKKKHTGKNVANAANALNLAGIIPPLIGAFVLGYSTVFLIAISIFFLSISIIPLLKINKDDINGFNLPKIKFKEIKRELFNYSILSALEVIIFTFWAIYAYESGWPLIDIGLIAVASSFANVIITEKIKNRLMEKDLRQKIKYISAILIIVLSIYRFCLPGHIIITNFLFGIVYLLFYLNIETELFIKLENKQTYSSSYLTLVSCFISRFFMVAILFFIGLKYVILLPIPLMLIYFFSIKRETKKIPA
ncbi:MAG: hypothetical protein A2469_01660 [Candidatus Magasanikbacteria bacterium RIFOXYC2_FULL_40_16]|uniref:Major facilitator superfamily (MFS) profile domain-containing protein n=2 Tax=Candidatus Magasanikiibacteriota TaxID=1752731 RepID=A0A1F6NEJ8_9BACT|nr:MAG: hypothetical protein A2373_02535 [Candidatus Magasanikbacteria bacterium RIFOXYB1_FULL_40_15]OGH86575.1 MAG: hypothetical protein A2301_03755 [Candidatus Magasanikbacteria bacterium RIFOXYB2_FULL_40_13]OGH89283.1 MAG: hypothetical protein A2469_01660 [Candidatus Magasanikbacteria bacterium RIFOXYC2_FULL_40_16]